MLANLARFVKEHYIAIASFLLILLLTLFVFSETKKRAEERRLKLFDVRATQATESLELRMRDYTQILIGAKALFIASDTVERRAWREYYETLNLEKNYPGIQGIGYSHVLKPYEVKSFERKVRAEGYKDFSIRPASPRDIYTSIIYIEPFIDRNLRAFGYDMFSNPVRRSAMQIARDTKQPTMSGKVRLVQETGQDLQAGFLIYLPVYKKNADPETIQDRQNLIKGYIYSPFRAKDLMNSVLGDDFQDLDVEVYDGTSPSEKSLLFSSDSTLHYGKTDKSRFGKLSTISMANHTWRVYCSARPSFGNSSDTELPYFILLGGLVISMLMSFIIWSLSNTRRSNRLKQTITDNATAALFILDTDGYCTFMNPAAEEMTGYTLEEMQSSTLHEMIHHTHPDGRPYPFSECPIHTTFAVKGSLRAHEDIFIRKDGSFFNVSCAVQPIEEEGGSGYTIIEVRDITEEKRTRQAITESEARFRTMADNAPVMIWVADAFGQCIYVNKQWKDFTGQSQEDSMDFGWQTAIDAYDLPYFESIYKKASAESDGFRAEYRMRRHDGQLRWVVSTGTARFGANGEFLGHIGSVLDITEIKEADRKVKQNAELLQKLFLEVPALVALVRAPDKQYVLANPLYRKLYGNRTLIGKTIREAHPELEGQGVLEPLEKVFETGMPYVGKEIPMAIDRKNDGNIVHGFFNLVNQPLLDAKNKVEAVLVFAVEVTELVTARKKMVAINEELSDKNNELIRINNDLDSFVYTASHDLKSPIANMEGLITLLRDILQGKLNEDDSEVLDMVGVSINKLKQTIADLAEITKVQKELQATVEPLFFGDILQDVKTDISNLISAADASIVEDFQVKEMLYARKNLRSILYNLVSNAIKYRSLERPVKVLVNTYREGDYVVLRVQDNGLGIKKEHQHKLFSMFKRLHKHVEGTGIGLYIVKRIIENNGGKIEVESQLGEGTTFKIYFKQEPVTEVA